MSNRMLKTIRPTLSDTRPLTHYVEGFNEVLIPEEGWTSTGSTLSTLAT